MSLFNQLINTYGRRAKLERSGAEQFLEVKVDDQVPGDAFPPFCQISARVDEQGNIRLTLWHPPLDDEVRGIIEAMGGTIIDRNHLPYATIDVRLSDHGKLRKLAKAIRRLVGRGRRYLDRNWKWICPRTADSLDTFAGILRAVRTESARRANTATA